jgi:hypothetical protein
VSARGWWRWLVGLAAVAVLLLAAPAANAHGAEEEHAPAKELVQQAIALIVNSPDDQMAIEDKINDALESDETDGVDLGAVREAKTAFTAGDLRRTQSLLETSIGARPHLSAVEPKPIRTVPADLPPAEETSTAPPHLATGEETGTVIATEPLPGRGGLTGTDDALLAAAGVVGLAGLWLSWHFRPSVRTRSLRTVTPKKAAR